MDSLGAFMRETYIDKPDNRLTVKEIYENFRDWFIEKYDIAAWNNITQRQVYTALKCLPNYNYVRYREGYCLKGIAHKSTINNSAKYSKNQQRTQNIEFEKNTLNLDTIQTKPIITLNVLGQPQQKFGATSSNSDIKIERTVPIAQQIIFPRVSKLSVMGGSLK